MARAITAPELVYLRSSPQTSKLRCEIINMPAIFAAQVNQTFATTDCQAQVTFDTVTIGAYTDLKPDMTMWVGSAAGLYDLGQVRIRKAATSTIIYFGETSEIPWANRLYLTAFQDYALWAKPVQIISDLAFIDYDIAYTDQHTNYSPVPIMGSHQVVKLTGASAPTVWSAAGSWVPNSTIASYLWTAPGASATSGLTTATPTLTYNAAGTYLVSLTVTAANGKASTGWRYVVVRPLAEAASNIQLNSCRGSYQTGGWEFNIRMYTGATTTLVRDRALCILYADDQYGATQVSIGPLAGSENIIAAGWITGDNITRNPQGGYVEFNVAGPQYWLNVDTNFTLGIENQAGVPTAWTNAQNFTVDMGLQDFVVWRSTCSAVCDVYPTGDTRVAPGLVASSESLWSQLTTILEATIAAHPACDRYGRLIPQVDQQFIPYADRSTIPTVMDITKNDTLETVRFERSEYSKKSRLELSGVSVTNAVSSSLFSLAPGHVYKHHGDPEVLDRLLLSSQAQANALAGLILGQRNNIYPRIEIPLRSNNRMIDFVPYQYVTLAIAAGDTPRGVTFSGRVIPRQVEISTRSGALLTSIVGEAETFQDIAITGDTPPGIGAPPTIPPFPPPPPVSPPIPPIPPIPPNPTVIPPIGIVCILFPGYGVYTMDMSNAGNWWSSTTGWGVPADLANVAFMELSPTGILYLSDIPTDLTIKAASIWSQATAFGSPRTTVISNSQMDILYPPISGQHSFVQNMGFDHTKALGLAVGLSNHALFAGYFFALMDGSGVIHNTTFPGALVYGSYSSLQSYLDKWYYAGYVWSPTSAGGMVRLNNGLTTAEVINPTDVFGGINIGYHAAAADVYYLTNTPGAINKLSRWSSFGTAYTGLGITPYYHPTQPIACDPTGQYVFLVIQGIGASEESVVRSSDFGSTWSAALTIPDKDWNNVPVDFHHNMHVINLGDSNKWLVTFNQSTNIDPYTYVPNLLQIWYTDDFGATFTEWTGNLTALIPPASAASVLRTT